MSIKISCPKCNWNPDGGAYWVCDCNFVWNTFSTFGKCPNCSKIHKNTQCPSGDCLGCGKWSDHLDWYKDLDRKLKDFLEKVLKNKVE